MVVHECRGSGNFPLKLCLVLWLGKPRPVILDNEDLFLIEQIEHFCSGYLGEEHWLFFSGGETVVLPQIVSSVVARKAKARYIG